MTRCTFLIIFNLLLFWSVNAQNIFLIERPGKVKNYKFYEGDKIHIKVKNYASISNIEGVLTQIRDSIIIIDDSYLIPIQDIITVYKERFWIKLVIPVMFIAGIGYIVLEAFNRAINKETPVITKETTIISSSLVAGGFTLMPLKEQKLNVGEKWRVKSLIFD